jgi:hypothetical protein
MYAIAIYTYLHTSHAYTYILAHQIYTEHMHMYTLPNKKTLCLAFHVSLLSFFFSQGPPEGQARILKASEQAGSIARKLKN